jgi:hypothetical protein
MRGGARRPLEIISMSTLLAVLASFALYRTARALRSRVPARAAAVARRAGR